MIRKTLLILFIYLGISFTLSVIQSCGSLLSYKATICDISFVGQKNKSTDFQPDTLIDDIAFIVNAESNRTTCSRPWTSTFLSNCYATTKCAKWQNELLQNSFRLSLDRNVIIAGDTIASGTDLFKLPTFVNGVVITEDEWTCRSITFTIKLTPDLISQMTFEPGVHTVSFSCNTNDNRTFNKERQVIFVL